MIQQLSFLNNARLATQVLKVNRNLLPVLQLLENFGFIRGYKFLSHVSFNTNCFVEVYFGYFDNKPLLKKIVFFNTTTFHKKKQNYFVYNQLFLHVKNSPGLYIVSTATSGIISHKEALERQIGGTVLAYVE